LARISRFKIVVAVLFISILSCSTQQVLLDQHNFHPNQTITIETRDGEKISGIVTHANADAVLMRDTSGKQRGFLTKNIVSAIGPSPILDDNGIIVSEAEIDSLHTSSHVTTYAFVGGFMSGGVSYLFSRMVTNEILKKNREAPLYIATVTGMSVGTILFAKAGDKKDREKAIDNVLAARSDGGYNISLPDLEDDKFLKGKIDEIKKDRQQKEQEIERLNNELKNKESDGETTESK
jgi:hypothetical protein